MVGTLVTSESSWSIVTSERESLTPLKLEAESLTHFVLVLHNTFRYAKHFGTNYISFHIKVFFKEEVQPNFTKYNVIFVLLLA